GLAVHAKGQVKKNLTQRRKERKGKPEPMMKYLPFLSFFALFAPLREAVVLAGDWPQFRGPSGAAVAAETDLPVKGSDRKNVRWKAELPGRGLSSPVIADGRVFVTASSGYRQRRLHVLCFDAAKGDKLWERSLASTGSTMCHPKTCMAAPTPVTDGR